MSPIGAAVFTGGRLSRALEHADRLAAEVVQVFAANPRGWARSAGDPEQDRLFRDGCAARGIPAYVHATYLVNLGSPLPATADRSAAALRHALGRAYAIGARGVVFHAGSAVTADRLDAAYAQLHEVLLPVLDGIPADGPRLLVEPTAGGGRPLTGDHEEKSDDYLRCTGTDEGHRWARLLDVRRWFSYADRSGTSRTGGSAR